MEAEVGIRDLTVTGVQAWGASDLESVTVAVQLVEAPAAKAGGLQLTVVTVGCLVTVTAAAVALEELSWVASPSYVATMGWGPTGLEDRKSVVEGKSVDLGGRRIIKKKKRRPCAGGGVGEASAKKFTVPRRRRHVAFDWVWGSVVLVEDLAAKAGGLQLTVVTVGCLVTVTAAAVALEELSWVASPSYVATMVWGPTVLGGSEEGRVGEEGRSRGGPDG